MRAQRTWGRLSSACTPQNFVLHKSQWWEEMRSYMFICFRNTVYELNLSILSIRSDLYLYVSLCFVMTGDIFGIRPTFYSVWAAIRSSPDLEQDKRFRKWMDVSEIIVARGKYVMVILIPTGFICLGQLYCSLDSSLYDWESPQAT